MTEKDTKCYTEACVTVVYRPESLHYWWLAISIAGNAFTKLMLAALLKEEGIGHDNYYEGLGNFYYFCKYNNEISQL